jgi:predicted lactoylglutathione lyase
MMDLAQTVFDQVNLIVKDMDATMAFYSRLGLRIPPASTWPPGSQARHAEVAMPSGVRLEFDNYEMAAIWNPGWTPRDGSARAVLGFSLPSREAVDTLYGELTAAGYAGRQPPHDAFWGARYAIVQDPDGNEVGLMSPKDPQRRFIPAA